MEAPRRQKLPVIRKSPTTSASKPLTLASNTKLPRPRSHLQPNLPPLLSDNALLDIIKALWSVLSAFFVGMSRQQVAQMEADLAAVDRANRAAAGVELLSADDVVRDLKKRRLYRLSGK